MKLYIEKDDFILLYNYSRWLLNKKYYSRTEKCFIRFNINSKVPQSNLYLKEYLINYYPYYEIEKLIKIYDNIKSIFINNKIYIFIIIMDELSELKKQKITTYFVDEYFYKWMKKCNYNNYKNDERFQINYKKEKFNLIDFINIKH